MLILNCILTKLSINLSELEPHLNGFTPDLATPISKMKEEAIKITIEN
jgi:aconitase A